MKTILILIYTAAIALAGEQESFRMVAKLPEGLLVYKTQEVANKQSNAARAAGAKVLTHWVDDENFSLVTGYKQLPASGKIFTCKATEAGTKSLGPEYGGTVATVYKVTE